MREPQASSYYRALLADQRGALFELQSLVCMLLAARRIEANRRRDALRPEIDLAAERVVLAATMRGAACLVPDASLFGHPVHAMLARAIATGDLAPELNLPEMRGYRRGLARMTYSIEQLRTAAARVLDLAERRQALESTIYALRALRRGEGRARVVAELRGALEALEGVA